MSLWMLVRPPIIIERPINDQLIDHVSLYRQHSLPHLVKLGVFRLSVLIQRGKFPAGRFRHQMLVV